jgi:hydroxypyruvate isomerase
MKLFNGCPEGRPADDGGAETLLKSAHETAQVGKRLGVDRLNLHGTGLGDGGIPIARTNVMTGAMWLKARDTLNRICDMAEDEGDLIRWCQKCLPWIGEVRVADSPGRCEPGSGKINFAGVAKALPDKRYRGPVGMKAFAAGDPETALTAFRAAFTV